MTADQCPECGKLALKESKYCGEHKPIPADKYAPQDSVEWKIWKKENPERAKKFDKSGD